MRRALLAVVLVALFASPAAARADTVNVPLVHGTIVLSFHYAGQRTVVNRLVLVGAQPGSEIALDFERGAPRRVDRSAGPTGTVDLSGAAKLPRTFAAGETIVTGIRYQGRVQAGRWTMQARKVPVSALTCYDAAGVATSCSVACDQAVEAPAGDPCEGAGVVIDVASGKLDQQFSGDRVSTQIERLRLRRVPAQSSVVIMCDGYRTFACPFYLRAITPSNGTADLARLFRNWRFGPGVKLTFWIVSGIASGDVVRYTFRRGRKPRFEKLCILPGTITPHRSCSQAT